jgi:hypothetical protein
MNTNPVLVTENTRPDKVVVTNGDGKVLFYVRLNESGSLFFEFDRPVSLDLKGSNCFATSTDIRY